MKRYLKRLAHPDIIKWAVFFLLTLSAAAVTEAAPELVKDVRISSSPNPLGSGARALGMGSAFIGVADDATAASWNPAGLIQLETPELSIVGSGYLRSENHSSTSNPAVNGTQSWNSSEVNYFSMATPFYLAGMQGVVSLNYQALYDLNRELNYSYSYAGSQQNFPLAGQTTTWDITQTTSASQKGGMRALSPAVALQLTPSITAGATLNLWTDALGYANGIHTTMTNRFKGSYGIGAAQNPSDVTMNVTESYDKPKGVSANLGLMWDLSSLVRIGAVIKTPVKVSMHHQLASVTTATQTGSQTGSQTIDENVTLFLPWSYGVGTALRFSDAFTLAFDLYRSEWQSAYIQSAGGSKMNPVDGLTLDQTGVKATHHIRLGGEYLFILPKTVIPLRAGIYYDPQPSPTGTDAVYGVSIGSGYMIDNLVFDIAYALDWGSGLNGEASGVPQSRYDLLRHQLYASCIVHF